LVKLLFDTHLLLWAVREPERLSRRAAGMLEDASHDRCFSVVSLWEAIVKSARRKPDFDIDCPRMRVKLFDSGFSELDVVAKHVFALRALPPIHGDPFDRLLVAQSIAEELTLVTADKQLAAYPARIILV
jgi:PIN domain nuclease of toxin-antitoxin system